MLDAVISPTLSEFGIVYGPKILFNEVLLRFWEGVELDASIQSVLCSSLSSSTMILFTCFPDMLART